jgi:hypothetical protein
MCDTDAETEANMAVRPAKPAAPASGGPRCVCPGDTCDPWCTCLACDSRPEALCHLENGTTLGAVVHEMIETLADGGCENHVFTRVGRGANGALVLVFDAPGGTGDPARRLRDDPFVQELGAHDVEPATEAQCLTDPGAAFGGALREMAATLPDGRCGDHVVAQADATKRVFSRSSSALPATPATRPPQEDPEDPGMGEMLPDTRDMRAFEAAATAAVEGMERLFGNGAVEAGEAHAYLMQLKGIKTQMQRLADVFARADAVYGEAYPVYTVALRPPDNGTRRRRHPPAKVFRSWEDALAFVAGAGHCDTVTIQSGVRRGDGSAPPGGDTPLARLGGGAEQGPLVWAAGVDDGEPAGADGAAHGGPDA